jgi:predicted ester cyclase
MGSTSKIAADFRAAFPDLQTAIDFMVEEGEFVVSRWTAEGTHTGPWADIAPTGKRIRFCGVNIYRIRNGKVIELWNHRDDLGVMQQLGVPIFAGSR